MLGMGEEKEKERSFHKETKENPINTIKINVVETKKKNIKDSHKKKRYPGLSLTKPFKKPI